MSQIEEYIMREIREIDITQIVREEVRKQISGDIAREIAKSVRSGIDQIINTEIEIVLSKGVETDDGWGKKVQYKSFEDLFKEEFQKKLNSNYEMKKMLEKAVQDHVAMLFRQSYDEVSKKVVDGLLKKI